MQMEVPCDSPIRTPTPRVVRRQSILAIICLLGASIGSQAARQNAKRAFTVADDIGLSHFGSHTGFDDDPFVFSPNHRFLAVYTEHGRLDINRPESILRVYSTDDIVHVLMKKPQSASMPPPVWEIRKSSWRHGPIVSRVRWLRDSSGVAFLAKTALGNNQLLLAELRTKIIHPLTNADQYVTDFDIRTQHNFVYTVLAAAPPQGEPGLKGSVVIGTGKNILSLMFPNDLRSQGDSNRSEIWAVVGDHRFELRDPASSRALTLYPKVISLSPDGHSLVTVLPVEVVPPEWEKLYPPPPLPWGSVRVRAGRQDLEKQQGFGIVEEYVVVDLRTEKIRSLTGAPSASSASWWAWPSADWSPDGKFVALSGVFVHSGPPEHDSITRPCVAVLDIGSLGATCLESIHGAAENDRLEWHIITRVRFSSSNNSRVTVDSLWPGDQYRSSTYTQESDTSWKRDMHGDDGSEQQPFALSIKQGLNDPPVLWAADLNTRVSGVIWDPNPQLRDVALGDVSVFRWKNQSGHDDIGGLFKPPDYVPGRRYPLVIQNHGFEENQFNPSGAYPTAFAAQELAAFGMLVLQVRGDSCPFNVPEEAQCAAANYEAAANELVKAGMADPDNLGIIGFSRTCYSVLEELTSGKLHFKAATITDGVNYGYFQYLLSLDYDQSNVLAREADSFVGAPPFGDGLKKWLERSPTFRMDRVATPLQVVALDSHQSLMGMWEPYATLRYLQKPVDLIVIPDSEHVITSPEERMISQGGTVDWLRFWLKDEEDPDPNKAQQYARWRVLRRLKRP
jgi:Prolyl oligopeptidase family